MSAMHAELLEPASVGGVAFLGCGQAAALHARTLRRLDRGLRTYFASRDPERARDYAERYGGAGWFAGYEAALASPEVDVAVVVTPPALHLEWSLAALAAGKHVIVEKPAFVRLVDFDTVAQEAQRVRRRVLVAENYPYKPLASALRRLFAEDLLGRLLFLHVNALKRQHAEGWRDVPAVVGGGALLEGGIHWVGLLTHLGPRVVRVRALSPSSTDEADRSIQLLLEYDQGTVASLAYSWEVPSPLKGIRLSRAYGTEGTATFESNGLFFAARGRRWLLRAWTRDVLGFGAMFRDLLQALREGTIPSYTLADARADVALIEQAYRDAGLRESRPTPDPRGPRAGRVREDVRERSAT